MLATLRAHPLQLGESRVHGCCTHIQLECKHRALKNSTPQMPSPTTEGELPLISCPESFLRRKCSQMLMQGSPTQWRVVSRKNHCFFPIQPFHPEHQLCGNCRHITAPISQAAARSDPRVHKGNSRATEDPHVLWPVHNTFPSHPLWNPDFVWAWPKPKSWWLLNQFGEFPSFSKQKPGDLRMNVTQSPPLSGKIIKLQQSLSAGSPQT